MAFCEVDTAVPWRMVRRASGCKDAFELLLFPRVPLRYALPWRSWRRPPLWGCLLYTSFPAGDTDALAERIDWWIEHPAERQEMERRYAEHAKQYSLAESIRRTEEMFRQAIAEQRGMSLFSREFRKLRSAYRSFS